MGNLVMGYWDCPVCGNKEIRGDVTNCPSCGRARGDVKFYMKGYTEGEIREENERDDIEFLSEEQASHFSDNPDWYCSFCNSLNSDNAQFCGNCGATRADSEANYFEMLKKKQEREAAEAAAQPQPSSRAGKPRSKLWLGILAILAILLVVWLWPRSKAGTVKDFSWACQIATENYEQVTEEDWSVPEGGEYVSQQEKIYTYESVLAGYRDVTRTRDVLDHYETYYTYEDRGNGTFEQVSHERPVYRSEEYTVQEPVYQQVPRYKTAYTYTIWKWVAGTVYRASGEDHTLVWPEIEYNENKREADNGRSAEFGFTFINDKGEAVSYRLNENDWKTNESVWNSLAQGQPVVIKTGGGSAVLQDENKKDMARIVQVK